MDDESGLAKRSPYTRRLSANHQEIRTLQIQPGAKDDPIICTLQTVSLNYKPEFAALSYVWGSPGATKSIIVEGVQFQATANLEAALRHIRDETTPKNMWIDAICINQSDMEERIQQVQLMRALYTGASEVLIWLG
ncbi:HET-domain-containing protein, partial [Cadophora sp. DSE1049]